MLLLVEIPILVYPAPSDSVEIQLFVAVIMAIDLVLITVNLIVIYASKKSAEKVFNTMQKWKLLSTYTKNVLSFLPVTDEMANEFQADAEEAQEQKAAAAADLEKETKQ